MQSDKKHILSSLISLRIQILFEADVNLINGKHEPIHCVFFSENFENADLQHDNVAALTLPLRYAVDMNVHG